MIISIKGPYTLEVDVDDKAEIYIDGDLVLTGHLEGGPDTSTPIILSEGNHDFRLKFVDYGTVARVILKWKLPGADSFEIISSEYFGHTT